MKSKTRLTVDLILTAVIILCSFISLWAESYRKFVFILGVIYCISLLMQMFFSIIQIKKEKFPIGIVITLIALILINNPSVNFGYVIIPNKTFSVISILIIALLTLILALSMVFLLSKKSFVDFLLLLVINGLVSSAIILYGFIPMTNYAFDTTKTIQTDVVIMEYSGEESLLGAWLDRHYIYEVNCSENASIVNISVDSEYGLKNAGDVIPITYRKGLFVEIYKVDYQR